MDISFLLTSAVVLPLYYVGRVKRYSVVYHNRVPYLVQYSTEHIYKKHEAEKR